MNLERRFPNVSRGGRIKLQPSQSKDNWCKYGNMDSLCGAKGQGQNTKWIGMHNVNISIDSMWLDFHNDSKDCKYYVKK